MSPTYNPLQSLFYPLPSPLLYPCFQQYLYIRNFSLELYIFVIPATFQNATLTTFLYPPSLPFSPPLTYFLPPSFFSPIAVLPFLPFPLSLFSPLYSSSLTFSEFFLFIFSLPFFITFFYPFFFLILKPPFSTNVLFFPIHTFALFFFFVLINPLNFHLLFFNVRSYPIQMLLPLNTFFFLIISFLTFSDLNLTTARPPQFPIPFFCPHFSDFFHLYLRFYLLENLSDSPSPTASPSTPFKPFITTFFFLSSLSFLS